VCKNPVCLLDRKNILLASTHRPSPERKSGRKRMIKTPDVNEYVSPSSTCDPYGGKSMAKITREHN